MSDGPGLAEELAQLPGLYMRKGPLCTVAKLLEELGGSDQAGAEALRRVVDDTRVAPAALSRLMTDRGHRLTAGTVRRHRSRGTGSGCACPT